MSPIIIVIEAQAVQLLIVALLALGILIHAIRTPRRRP